MHAFRAGGAGPAPGSPQHDGTDPSAVQPRHPLDGRGDPAATPTLPRGAGPPIGRGSVRLSLVAVVPLLRSRTSAVVFCLTFLSVLPVVQRPGDRQSAGPDTPSTE